MRLHSAGVFLKTAPVLFAYLHTHPPWMEEYFLYVGASGAQLGMASLGISSASADGQAQNMTEISLADVSAAKAQLAARAKEAGAAMVCRYKRSDQLREIYPGAPIVRGALRRPHLSLASSGRIVTPFSAIHRPPEETRVIGSLVLVFACAARLLTRLRPRRHTHRHGGDQPELLSARLGVCAVPDDEGHALSRADDSLAGLR